MSAVLHPLIDKKLSLLVDDLQGGRHLFRDPFQFLFDVRQLLVLLRCGNQDRTERGVIAVTLSRATATRCVQRTSARPFPPGFSLFSVLRRFASDASYCLRTLSYLALEFWEIHGMEPIVGFHEKAEVSQGFLYHCFR